MTLSDTSDSTRPAHRAAAGSASEHLATLAGLFRAQLKELPDPALDGTTLIPGITRRHLIGHVHHGALVLGRLAQSASSSATWRGDGHIERWADWRTHSGLLPARHLRDLARWSQEDLEHIFEELESRSRASSTSTLVDLRAETRRLRSLRIRELAVHVVDLNTGVTFSDLPSDLSTALAFDHLESPAGVRSRCSELAHGTIG